jgi:hypothetical protein
MNVRTITLLATIAAEGRPDADELVSSVNEDLVVSPFPGQQDAWAEFAGQSDEDGVRTVKIRVVVEIEGHPSADEILDGVREDFDVSPLDGQVSAIVELVGQADSESAGAASHA